MLQQLIKIFGSRTKALEVLYLLNDLKPVVRQGFYTHELSEVEKFCQEQSLFIKKSPLTITLEEKESFSNRGKITEKSDPQGMIFVYISKNEEKALLTCLYETKQDHYTTGIMLGYPECCARFFEREFEKGNLNPMHKPTNVWTNLAQRDKDCIIISHFPCSSNCKGSIEIAKKNLLFIQKNGKKMAERIMNQLKVM